MILTNQTTQDYWFGPLHLAGGVGQQLTVDDTSATSLYLTDDGVADAINAAVASSKVVATSTAQPFPRAIGTPQFLHGDGQPEGLVYATQGSVYLRRDTGTMFQKTTGLHLNTGWAIVGGAQPIVVTAVSQLPASPSNGQQALLRLGSSPFVYLLLTYESGYAHWVSDSRTIHPADTNGTFCNGSYNTTIGSGSTNTCYVPIEALGLLVSSGLTLQKKITLDISNGSNSYGWVWGYLDTYNRALSNVDGSWNWLTTGQISPGSGGTVYGDTADTGWVSYAGTISSSVIGLRVYFSIQSNASPGQTTTYVQNVTMSYRFII